MTLSDPNHYHFKRLNFLSRLIGFTLKTLELLLGKKLKQPEFNDNIDVIKDKNTKLKNSVTLIIDHYLICVLIR